MAQAPLILTYHAIEKGPPPLYVEPELFREHLDAIEQAGGRTSTVGELASDMRAGHVPARTVVISFDDGFESVFENALPMLLERGLTATVFCVAGHLGGANDWKTQPPGTLPRPLAGAEAIAEIAEGGIEVGSHGVHHAPLGSVLGVVVERELRESRERLEEVTGRDVVSFAYPYGSIVGASGAQRVRELYSAACTTRLGQVRPSTDPYELPRVDAHYVRRPALLRRAVEGSLGPYLRVRAAGARVRRLAIRDYAG